MQIGKDDRISDDSSIPERPAEANRKYSQGIVQGTTASVFRAKTTSKPHWPGFSFCGCSRRGTNVSAQAPGSVNLRDGTRPARFTHLKPRTWKIWY